MVSCMEKGLDELRSGVCMHVVQGDTDDSRLIDDERRVTLCPPATANC